MTMPIKLLLAALLLVSRAYSAAPGAYKTKMSCIVDGDSFTCTAAKLDGTTYSATANSIACHNVDSATTDRTPSAGGGGSGGAPGSSATLVDAQMTDFSAESIRLAYRAGFTCSGSRTCESLGIVDNVNQMSCLAGDSDTLYCLLDGDSMECASAADYLLQVDCTSGSVPLEGVCQKCDRGTYHDIASAQCLECPEDTFQVLKGQTSCTPCPAGKYNALEGQTACKVCPVTTNPSNAQCYDPANTVPVVAEKACAACNYKKFELDEKTVKKINRLTAWYNTNTLPWIGFIGWMLVGALGFAILLETNSSLSKWWLLLAVPFGLVTLLVVAIRKSCYSSQPKVVMNAQTGEYAYIG